MQFRQITIILLTAVLFGSFCASPAVAEYDSAFPNTYSNTGNLAADLVGVAISQAGYKELDGKNGQPLPDGNGVWYTKYGDSYEYPSAEWCAFFVLWCAKEAGIDTSIIPQSATYASCGKFVGWLKSNHRWHDTAGYTPSVGDLIFYDWEGDGSANHIGIVTGVSANGINTVEGNTLIDGYYQVGRLSRTEHILGYGNPDYALSSSLNGTAQSRTTAYMLPSSGSPSVWEVWQGDRLQVLCRDGDYYLVLYPYIYSGKFVAAYVPVSSVSVTGTIPDAASYYSVNRPAVTVTDATVYHNPSTDPLLNSSGTDNKVRATILSGNSVQVLFQKGGFYFVKTNTITGFVQTQDISLNSLTLAGDVNGDGVLTKADADLILKYDVGLTILSSDQLRCGDLNKDGKVDAGDAGYILNHK